METIAVERSLVIHADRERVWRAITTPEVISEWFEMGWDFQLVAGAPITFTYEGKTLGGGMILTVEPPERFVLRWTAEPGYDTMTTVTFQLDVVAEGTRVTITESGFEALPEDMRHKRAEDNSNGWRIQLDNLAAYLRRTDHA